MKNGIRLLMITTVYATCCGFGKDNDIEFIDLLATQRVLPAPARKLNPVKQFCVRGKKAPIHERYHASHDDLTLLVDSAVACPAFALLNRQQQIVQKNKKSAALQQKKEELEQLYRLRVPEPVTLPDAMAHDNRPVSRRSDRRTLPPLKNQ